MTDNKDQPETNSDSQNDDNKPPSEQFNPSLLQKATPEYLQELLLDKKTLQNFPNTFKHLELILEKGGPLEIAQVRERLFHKNGSIQMNNTDLPDPSGQIVTLQRKVFIPVKENPTYNFVGRLLGPRGLTAKQMEQDLGCKIMVRGKGSMRDKRKEDQNRGKPNWEHLQEELHVLVSVEDYESRAELRLQHAVNAITVFLEQGLRTPEDKDLLKQTQLMELAVLNDKERQQAQVQQLTQQQQHQYLLQQQYLSMLSSQTALAALTQNPAAQLLSAAGLRFGTPTASAHPSVAAANPLLLGATANAPTPVNATTPNAATAAMNLAAVMGGMPTTASTTAVNPQLGGALSNEQLAALFGVANGTVSPNGADASAAMAAAGFHGTFPTNSAAGTNMMGDYSNATDIDGSSVLHP
ncbi:unnamed protein product [Hymenolepis diminuta]|uniref:K Homology domain-containing protein n=1 Tax=Hymenolepis diminuta TaxID=6216 RepID=A0A564YML5_HYMDI|nr:unnamed protein product [Hymenolepis diminuta]